MHYLKTSILFFFIILMPIGFSQYYGDLDIEVDETGITTIKGLSTIPSLETPLKTHEYTSKEGKYWVFNLTTNTTISSFIYELTLPKGANINYIETAPDFRLRDNDGRISIIGSGDNRPLKIIVQYQISSQTNSNQSIPFIILYVFFIILGGIGGIFLRIFFKNKKTSLKPLEKHQDKKKEDIDFLLFTPRQKDILTLLMKKKKISQKELENLLEIPKSSLSRNIRTLEMKGYISKRQIGNTNYIVLNELHNDSN